MSHVCENVQTDHKDLIHDVSYDYYGKRLATCSSDHSVKIWDQDEDGKWTCTGTLVGHNGPVWKVTWAHPEFGQIIATCSFDRTAAVWEETIGDFGDGCHSKWIRRTSLVDSRSSVTDVKFAPNPKVQGLLLATCSADGAIKIYEASDVMTLYQWTPTYDISTKLTSCSCLSWNPSISRLYNSLIAVGSDDPNPSNTGKVAIYEFLESSHKWVKVESLITINEPVHDLAFSPNLGRSYHLLAIATKDLHIVSLKPNSYEDQNQSSLTSFEVRQAGQFNDHGSAVWRVSWNMIGTILASSGDDGAVKLWKANYLDVWGCISTMKGNEIVTSDQENEGKNASTCGTPSQQSLRFFKSSPMAPPKNRWQTT